MCAKKIAYQSTEAGSVVECVVKVQSTQDPAPSGTASAGLPVLSPGASAEEAPGYSAPGPPPVLLLESGDVWVRLACAGVPLSVGTVKLDARTGELPVVAVTPRGVRLFDEPTVVR
jgi:hypothetical protein